MTTPKNVVPFKPDRSQPEDDQYTPSNVLGILHRKDFELWVCRSPGGPLSLKWWRWRGDLEKFFPLEEGELTLDPADLKPLSDLLVSVENLMQAKGLK